MTATTAKMPAGERAKLADDDELNQMRAAYFLGIGRSTLAAITGGGLVRVVRPAPRVIRYRVGDLRAYEQSVTTGGPAAATPTTTKRAKA
jgi:glycerate-2-kinase